MTVEPIAKRPKVSEPHFDLLGLPTEVLVQLLNDLSPQNVARVEQGNKTLLQVIRSKSAELPKIKDRGLVLTWEDDAFIEFRPRSTGKLKQIVVKMPSPKELIVENPKRRTYAVEQAIMTTADVPLDEFMQLYCDHYPEFPGDHAAISNILQMNMFWRHNTPSEIEENYVFSTYLNHLFPRFEIGMMRIFRLDARRLEMVMPFIRTLGPIHRLEIVQRYLGIDMKDNDGAYADQKAPENDDSQEMSRDQLRAVIEHLTPRKMTIFSDALLSDSTFYNLECVKNARKIALAMSPKVEKFPVAAEEVQAMRGIMVIFTNTATMATTFDVVVALLQQWMNGERRIKKKMTLMLQHTPELEITEQAHAHRLSDRRQVHIEQLETSLGGEAFVERFGQADFADIFPPRAIESRATLQSRKHHECLEIFFVHAMKGVEVNFYTVPPEDVVQQ